MQPTTASPLPAAGSEVPSVSFTARCVAGGPKAAKRAPVRGKATLTISGDGLSVSGVVRQGGKAALWALVCTVVGHLAAQLAAIGLGFAFAPGFLIWLLIFDAAFRRKVVLISRPGCQAVYDPQLHQCSVRMCEGDWLTFVVKPKSSDSNVIIEAIEGFYGSRYAVGELSRFSAGEKVQLLIILGLLASAGAFTLYMLLTH